MKIELNIIDLFVRNPEKKFTINEIAKAINEYYSFAHRTVIKLINGGVLLKTKIGKACLCELNLDNEKTLVLIQLSEIERKNEFYEIAKDLKLILEDSISLLKPKSNLLSVVLFGSYAKGKATKESDIDILLLTKRDINVERIVKEIYAKYGKEINIILMTSSNFKKQRRSLLIKEIANNHIILYGAENFVRLMLK